MKAVGCLPRRCFLGFINVVFVLIHGLSIGWLLLGNAVYLWWMFSVQFCESCWRCSMSVNKSARMVSCCSPSAFSLIPETRTDDRRLCCSRLSSDCSSWSMRLPMFFSSWSIRWSFSVRVFVSDLIGHSSCLPQYRLSCPPVFRWHHCLPVLVSRTASTRRQQWTSSGPTASLMLRNKAHSYKVVDADFTHRWSRLTHRWLLKR